MNCYLKRMDQAPLWKDNHMILTFWVRTTCTICSPCTGALASEFTVRASKNAIKEHWELWLLTFIHEPAWRSAIYILHWLLSSLKLWFSFSLYINDFCCCPLNYVTSFCGISINILGVENSDRPYIFLWLFLFWKEFLQGKHLVAHVTVHTCII